MSWQCAILSSENEILRIKYELGNEDVKEWRTFDGLFEHLGPF